MEDRWRRKSARRFPLIDCARMELEFRSLNRHPPAGCVGEVVCWYVRWMEGGRWCSVGGGLV